MTRACHVALFVVIVTPLYVLAALVGGWPAVCLIGIATGLVVGALLDPG